MASRFVLYSFSGTFSVTLRGRNGRGRNGRGRNGRGRNGPFYRAAPRTNAGERNYRKGLLTKGD